MFDRSVTEILHDLGISGYDEVHRVGRASVPEADYQYPGLMKLAKHLKSKDRNFQLAELFEMLRGCVLSKDDQNAIESLDLVKIFLNMRIKTEYIVEKFRLVGPGTVGTACRAVAVTRAAPSCGAYSSATSPPVVVDYSSPNVAKSLHVGHLRSTIIGEALVRFLKFRGHNVLGVNHIGDWGTQFGMMLHLLKSTHPRENIVDNIPGTSDGLLQLYREAKRRFDQSREFADGSRRETHLLQQGDELCGNIWKAICATSNREYREIYERLNVLHLEEKGESFYQSLIPTVIELLAAEGFISESDGARIIKLDGFQCPLIMVKSDGGYTYDTTDMAALYYRLVILGAKRAIYITDVGQRGHFSMCFALARKMGWADTDDQLVHIGFGLILGKDGKKLKSRSGDTVRLVDVMEEVTELADKTMRDKIAKSTDGDSHYRDMTADEVSRTSIRVGMNTLKYFILKYAYETNFKYDPSVMFQFNGDTGVYLMYVYARINGILEKSKCGTCADDSQGEDVFLGVTPTREERELMLHICSLPDVLEKTDEDLSISNLADFLYRLCVLFNTFNSQRDGKIIGSDLEQYRTRICLKVSRVMKVLFDILNIQEMRHI